MKRASILYLLCFVFSMSWAQKNDFNSLCIWIDDSCHVFQDTRIDSITFSNLQNDYTQDLWIDGKAYSFQASKIDSVSLFNLYDTGITSYTVENKQNWEEVYTTSIGTFAYNSILKYNESEYSDLYEVLSYIGEDWMTSACILYDREKHLPVRLTSDSVAVFFSYVGDSVVSVAIGNNTCVTTIGEYEIDLKEIANSIKEQGYTSILKEHIFRLLSCLRKENIADTNIRILLERFESLLDKNESKCAVSEQTKYIIIVKVYDSDKEPKKKGKGNILYSAVVATNGCYDLTDTSCKPSGSVYIAYSHYNEDCTYGILVDENPDNLYCGKAAFSATGYQEPLSSRFFVNVSGLTPSTKYYYRAYLRIDPLKYKNSPLVIKYDNGNHEEDGYDPMRPTLTYGNIETFTTNPTDISGTWICTEEYYFAWDKNYEKPQYKDYPILLREDGTVSIDGKSDYVRSSWRYGSDGRLTISVTDMSTSDFSGGFDINLKADDSKAPKKFTGAINDWSFNSTVGYVSRGGNAVVLTR